MMGPTLVEVVLQDFALPAACSSQCTVAVPEQALSAGSPGFFASSGVRKAVLLARYTDLLHDW